VNSAQNAEGLSVKIIDSADGRIGCETFVLRRMLVMEEFFHKRL
jgi:hypothetical protein